MPDFRGTYSLALLLQRPLSEEMKRIDPVYFSSYPEELAWFHPLEDGCGFLLRSLVLRLPPSCKLKRARLA